jgi:beta-xylosidase
MHKSNDFKHKVILGLVLFYTSVFSQNAQNPIIYADVPDASMIRVGDTYYMASTTMHMSPGIPIMKSTNLVNWTIVNYAYDRLIENDKMNLTNGQEAYGNGSWASSINYKDGLFYIHTFSYTSGRSHIYKTNDIENGTFTAQTLSSLAHDASLFFDDDGRVYLAYGHDNIELRELNADASDYKAGGTRQIIINNASGVAGSNMILTAEGTQMFKINGYYYVMNICWPSGNGRTVVIHRSRNITGPYEGRIALQDQGVAQGGLISTPAGKWYAYLFQDHGSVGRIPFIVPVTWENDWPVFGVNGKVPSQLDIPSEWNDLRGIVASDDFETLNSRNHGLKLEWQWNHNPVNNYWSLTDRPGFLRITNDRVDPDFVTTRNTLTQRTFGPACTASVAIEVNNMKDGDYAGLGALQTDYGFVGVKMSGSSKSIVMINGNNSIPVEIASVPLNQNRVHLRIRMDYNNKTDKAYFLYSLDGSTWQSIGNTLQMSYELDHFMGYRFSLFNFGTKSSGGSVDFDHYIINSYPMEPNAPPPVYPVPGKIEAEDYLAMSGIQVEPDADDNLNIGFINPGDWSSYFIDVSESGTYNMKINVATAATTEGSITVKNEQGVTLGILNIDPNLSDGWHDWYMDSIALDLNAGEQEIRLEYNGGSEYLFNIDWFELSPYVEPPTLNSPRNIRKDMLNPIFMTANGDIYLQVANDLFFRLEIYSASGVKLYDQPISNNNSGTQHIKFEGSNTLKAGLYYAVFNRGQSDTMMIKHLIKSH